MRKSTLVGGLAAALASMVLVVPPPTDAAAPTDNTGSIYSDLVVALRDVDGVPITDTYPVPDAASETCVLPVSYSALPLVSSETNPVDGRKVWRIPLVGDAPGEFDLTVYSVCDPQPAYAMYVSEAQLERLNLTRQPDAVKDKKLADIEIRFLTTDEITLDGAGRITTDGVPIDASPDQAAIYQSLMDTGEIPGLASPPQVGGFDRWMLAAAAIGTAASKGVPITIDTVEYYNRIVGAPDPAASWDIPVLAADVNGERFVDYGLRESPEVPVKPAFSYTRAAVFPGCATWLDVGKMTWMSAPVLDVVDFIDLVDPPTATLTNVAGFAQLADDVRSVINYLHLNSVIPGFYLDPVFENTCAAQQDALTNPAVMWGGVPADLIQTDTVDVTASAFMPWAGADVADAHFRMTIDAAADFTVADQVTAVPLETSISPAPSGLPVEFTVVDGNLVGEWPDPGFALNRGAKPVTTFGLTVADGAPLADYTMTLQLLDGAVPAGAPDVATVNVLPAQPTVLWTSTVDYVAQGSYFPMTARVFNPATPWGENVTGASLRVTITPPVVDPANPFVSASQVAAWSEAVAMPLTLVGTNLVGVWSLEDPLLSGVALDAGVDQLITWYLNVADGAPTGVYTIGVEIIKDGALLVPSTYDSAEVIVAAAPTHGGSGGGGGGGGGSGGGDGDTAAPSLQITSGPAVITSATDATFVFGSDALALADQLTAAQTALCGLDGAAPTSCTSPVTYTGLSLGSHTFSVVVIDANGQWASTSYTWLIIAPGEDSMIMSLAPVRFADTRPGWVAADGLFFGLGPVPAGGVVQVPIAGRGGVPVDAKAVVANVTLVGAAAPGYATVFPCGTVPNTSSVNYLAVTNEAVANEVIVKLSPTGSICVFTSSAANVLVDVAGYVPASSDFVSLTPVRLADTRPTPVAAGQVLTVPIAGRGGVPVDAKAVVANVTLVGAAAAGFATVFPCGTVPDASSVNYLGVANEAVANEVIAKLSPTGSICVYTNAAANVLVDVAGYVPASSDFVSLTPVRLADTRPTPVAAGQVLQVQIAGRGGVPVGAKAVVANVTLVGAAAPGFATVFPCGTVPDTSSVNYLAVGNEAVANEVIVKLSPAGSICVYSYAAANVLVDVAGYL